MITEQEKEEFMDAIDDDEYMEIELGDNVALITDWEGDGLFSPYLAVPSKDYQGHEHFIELLDENQVAELFQWNDIEIYEQHNMTYADFFGVHVPE